MASRISLNSVSVLSKQCLKQHWKNFSSQSSGGKITPGNSFNQPPLSKPLTGLPKPIFSSAKDEGESTRVTTLPSGLRVASENRFGQFCTIGVVIDSGSRFEVSYPSGISHFLEKLAFNSTKNFEHKEIFQILEKHGGICDCQSSRDTLVYAASADSRGFDAVVNILADVVYRPRITAEEVENVRQTIRFELESLMTRPEQELILTDMIHAAGYRSNTLGLPKICPAESVPVIDRSILLTYLRNHHTPERTVIAGVGVDHDALVESVQKHFEETKPIWETDVDVSELKHSERSKVDKSIAQYTGGLVKEECSIPLYAGGCGLPELAHVVLGVEGVSHQHADFVAICVLNMMMGGGGSFSAGGPGKGMYTRLYTNVLNRYHWMFSATAYNHSYADSGLFCVHASAPPAYVRDMVEVLMREFVSMTQQVSDIELRRAKTQLQSMLLMNLEARPVVFEDIARQVLATGHRKHPSVFIDAIESVSAADIERVTQRLLSSQPSIAARGAVQKLPTLQDIQAGLLDSGSSNQRRRLFTPK